MQVNVVNATGEASGKAIDLSDAAFAAEFNEPLVHQVVTAYLAASRAGTKAQKTRTDVRGGGAKPFRQKGTGRARAGTIRSPLWRGGGKVFAARPQDHSQKVNRKMYRGAMRSILSELVRQGRLVVTDAIAVSAPKTKELIAQLAKLGIDSALIVTPQLETNLALAARNIAHVEVTDINGVDPVSLVRYEKVWLTTDALKQLEERLG